VISAILKEEGRGFMFKFLYGFLVLFLAVLSSGAQAVCVLNGLHRPYQMQGKNGFYSIEVDESSVNSSSHGRFKNLNSFKSFIERRTFTDPYALIKKQYEFYKKFPDERARFEKVLQKRVGQIRANTCLEEFLMDAHLSQYPKETEFQAYVFTHPKKLSVKVIVNSSNGKFVGSDGRADRAQQKARKEGWKMSAHIHNHPFFFDNAYGDIAGTIIPSHTDVLTYRKQRQNFGLRQSVVTNGFDSFVLRGSEFNKL
jgi:hypothetical protein